MRLHGCMGDAFANGGRVDGAGEVTLMPEETEDLWHTFNLIAKDDRVLATTFRKVQKESSTGSVDSQKVRMSLAIQVQKVDFDPDGGSLRVGGLTVSEHEGLKLGSHHTLELELNRKYTIYKDVWDQMYLDQLTAATAGKVASADVAAVLMQPGLANVCLVSGGMTITRAKLETHIPTKGNAAVQQGAKKLLQKWHEQVLQAVLRHVDFSVVKVVVLAGPGFVKDQWWEYARGEMEKRELRELAASKSKWVLCHASCGYKHALKEVFSSGEMAARLSDTKAATETAALGRFFETLAADPDKVTYGLKWVQAAIEQGAVDSLLLADSLFRAQNVARRRQYVELVQAARAGGAKVHIFSSMHVSGDQLARFTGAAAILRFPVPLEQLLGDDALDGAPDDSSDDDDGDNDAAGADGAERLDAGVGWGG